MIQDTWGADSPELAFANYTKRLLDANARIWRGDMILATGYCAACNAPAALLHVDEPVCLRASPPGLKAQAIPWYQREVEKRRGPCVKCQAPPSQIVFQNLYIGRVFPLGRAVFVAALVRESGDWAPSMCYALKPAGEWVELGPMAGLEAEHEHFRRSFHLTEELFTLASAFKPSEPAAPVRTTPETVLFAYVGDLKQIVPALDALPDTMGLPPKYDVAAGPAGVFPAAMEQLELAGPFHAEWDRHKCGFIFVNSVPMIAKRLQEWGAALKIPIKIEANKVEFVVGGKTVETSLKKIASQAAMMVYTIDDALYDIYFWEGHVLDTEKMRVQREKILAETKAAAAAKAAASVATTTAEAFEPPAPPAPRQTAPSNAPAPPAAASRGHPWTPVKSAQETYERFHQALAAEGSAARAGDVVAAVAQCPACKNHLAGLLIAAHPPQAPRIPGPKDRAVALYASLWEGNEAPCPSCHQRVPPAGVLQIFVGRVMPGVPGVFTLSSARQGEDWSEPSVWALRYPDKWVDLGTNPQPAHEVAVLDRVFHPVEPILASLALYRTQKTPAPVPISRQAFVAGFSGEPMAAKMQVSKRLIEGGVPQPITTDMLPPKSFPEGVHEALKSDLYMGLAGEDASTGYFFSVPAVQARLDHWGAFHGVPLKMDGAFTVSTNIRGQPVRFDIGAIVRTASASSKTVDEALLELGLGPEYQPPPPEGEAAAAGFVRVRLQGYGFSPAEEFARSGVDAERVPWGTCRTCGGESHIVTRLVDRARASAKFPNQPLFALERSPSMSQLLMVGCPSHLRPITEQDLAAWNQAPQVALTLARFEQESDVLRVRTRVSCHSSGAPLLGFVGHHAATLATSDGWVESALAAAGALVQGPRRALGFGEDLVVVAAAEVPAADLARFASEVRAAAGSAGLAEAPAVGNFAATFEPGGAARGIVLIDGRV